MLQEIDLEHKPSNEEWLDYLDKDAVKEVPPQPGQLREGSVSHPGSADAPGTVTIGSLEFKGYVQIWNTKTGYLYEVPRNLLWQFMPLTFPGGKQKVYTMTDPRIPHPKGDNLPCYLHPSSPMYARLQGMGYPTCPKHGIPNRSALERHMSSSHKNTWKFVQDDKIESQRDEDRRLHREMMEALSTAAVKGMAPATVVVPDVTPKRPRAKKPAPVVTAECPECGKEFKGVTQKQAEQRVKLHAQHCPAKS